MRRVPGPSLFELDRLDPQQRRRLRLVLVHLGNERLRPLPVGEQLERGFGGRADDAVDEHGIHLERWSDSPQ
jgi:hypothetical protein